MEIADQMHALRGSAMTELSAGCLREAVTAADSQFSRLVLLVGGRSAGKTTALKSLSAQIDTRVVNLNLELSGKLLELTPKQRSLKTSEYFAELCGSDENVLLLDNLELVFDSELKQDPLRLLLANARSHTIVAVWPGRYLDGILTYAEPGHPEYRRYDSVDALIVNMERK